MKFYRLALSLFLLLASGCAGQLFQGKINLPSMQPTGGAPPSTAPTQPVRVGATPPSLATSAPAEPVVLRVWLPPRFNPADKAKSGTLLQARLDAFTAQRSNMRIEVRIKAMDGPGGLLDSLTAASAAAPQALPDLVALDRPMLETAALKGLLHPYDGMTGAMDNPDWFDYAHQLAHLQNSTFGLPFAGDALVMVYHPGSLHTPPADWAAALKIGGPLAFPAADPQALVTLAFYQSLGGAVRDGQGRPFINSDNLTSVFNFYQEAEQAGLMPYWLTQLQDDDQVWEAFTENHTLMAATWASHYLGSTITNTAVAPLPTQNGKPFTLATGWVWALASPQPERQALSVQLAEFLTEGNFLAEWTQAAGYLPPRPSALNSMSNAGLQTLLNEIITSAHLYPPADILNSLGPAMEQAAGQVLKKQIDPVGAAQVAVKDLSGP
ncbi:MAG TPA: extracellular solute-binding protein [Anaerolineales bacterium]